MQKIYLDNAATTPIDPKVLEAMLPYLKEDFGNASSIHSFGQIGREAIDKAREQAAQFLNCRASEIFFTGGATEADNMAIFGVVKSAQKKGPSKPHVITTAIEHPAVLEACQYLEKQGLAEVSYLPVGKEGIVKVEDVEKAIKPNTVLVSMMYANNEIGTIQPIAQIASLIRNLKNPKSEIRNSKQIQNSNDQNSKQYPLFHCDAVQAANYLDCDIEKLGVDLLTLSGHKIYGPKGVGALYVKRGVSLEPLVFGGHQEQGLRPGTENVAGIVGFGEAIAEVKIQNSKGKSESQKLKVEGLRDKLIDGILQKIPGSQLNGSRENRLPNNVNFSFAGAEGEAIVIALDQEGIAVSTGSACSSGSLEPSHVLLALGLNHQQAHSSVRFSLGKQTTEQEIDEVLEILPLIIERLRKISGRG